MSVESLNQRLAYVVNDPSFNYKGPEERYCCLMNEMRKDLYAFVLFHRLNCRQFDYLLYQLKPHLQIQPFSHELSLSLALRYLSCDDRIQVPFEVFGVDPYDIPFIVERVFEAIIAVLQPNVFSKLTYEELNEDVTGFKQLWNFPYCFGALEFRSINCQYSTESGQMSLNASVGFMSDAFCQFICLYICDPLKAIARQEPQPSGQSSNRFGPHSFHPNIYMSRFSEVEDQILNEGYVTVGGEDSNLLADNMRCYHIPTEYKEKVFNSRLDKAKSVVDNALGILFYQWRIFQSPLVIKEGTLQRVLGCCVVLHNWLMVLDTTRKYQRTYTPEGFFQDIYDLVPGDWGRFSITASVQPLKNPCPYELPEGQSRRDSFAESFETNQGLGGWHVKVDV